jgi:hypothetical protein
MPHYFLPRWIHVCVTVDAAVFLDIRHDRYLGLDCAQTRILSALLAGNDNHPGCEALAASLIEAGLLARQASEHTRPLAATSLAAPDSVLIEPDDELPAFNALHVVRFLASCIFVWVALHLHSLEYALSRLQARKALLRTSADSIAQIETAKTLAGVFLYLRTFVYTASDHCLYDSLVLSDFLQRYRVPSTCILGVRTVPFAAHCWVQTEGSLTTEYNLEYVAAFSPICAI